jgi:transcriptional regulator with XRE-family HTH domain
MAKVGASAFRAARRPSAPVAAPPPKPTPDAAAMGLAIRLFRVEQHISQVRLSEITGFAQSWISNIERGQRDPSWANVVRLAEGLNLTLTELVEGAESLVERCGRGPYRALDFTRSR